LNSTEKGDIMSEDKKDYDELLDILEWYGVTPLKLLQYGIYLDTVEEQKELFDLDEEHTSIKDLLIEDLDAELDDPAGSLELLTTEVIDLATMLGLPLD